MKDGAALPEWPTAVHRDTKAEAIAEAVAQLDPGDTITIHEVGCEAAYDLPCTCHPNVIVVAEARA